MVPCGVFVDLLLRLNNVNSKHLSDFGPDSAYEFDGWQDKRQSLLCLIDAAQQVGFDGAGIRCKLSLKAVEAFCFPHSVLARLHQTKSV